MENYLITGLAFAWISDVYFYGMQRYVQLISREVKIPFKLGKLLMLPTFYGFTFFLTLIKYGTAIYLIIYHDWKIVLYIVAPIFLISLFIPIPYKTLYRSIINKTLSKKMNISPEHISSIFKIQVESRLLN